MKRSLAIALTILGCFQFAGYFLNNRILRGIGFSFGASPRPTVFGTVEGVEGFNTQHYVVYINSAGDTARVSLDRNHYTKLQGSFLLKNTYSIFLAYPHMLKREQVKEGSGFLLCRQNIKAFGISDIKECLFIESQKVVSGKPTLSLLNVDCVNE